jgi:hypothetical protein
MGVSRRGVLSAVVTGVVLVSMLQSSLHWNAPRVQASTSVGSIHSEVSSKRTFREEYFYRATDKVPPVAARSFLSDGRPQWLPCWEPEPDWQAYTTQMTPTPDGFFFLKTYKTGSSTSSGIHLRMARNVARRRRTGFDLCKARFAHAWASSLYHHRDRKKSFLWTVVRDPTARAVSQLFHFHVSREQHNASDAELMGRVRSDTAMFRNYYLSSLSVQGYRPKKDDPRASVHQILQDYDFVAVTERMDESAVALAMILGLPLADVLYLKAKGHGGYDDAGGDGHSCTMIQPSFVSDGMEAFFRSDEYQDMVQWDYLLYQAANRSLDLTIESLGRDTFARKLLQYKKALALSVENCLAITRFPCSSTGQLREETDCLWKDSGCGSDCLDGIADELGLWH